MPKFKQPLFIILVIASLYACEKSENTNQKWYTISSGTQSDLLDIVFTSDNVGYILADSGVILKTNNKGNTWQAFDLPLKIRGHYNALHFVNDSIGYVYGSGDILKTSDGGKSWNMIYASNAVLNSMYFINAEIGFAVGAKFNDGGVILKTTDGGLKWEEQSSNDSYNILYSVYFLDANIGFSSGDKGQIIRTIDGGKTWTKYTSDTTRVISSLFFSDKNTGFASGGNRGGDDGTFFQTLDGGETWAMTKSNTRFVGSIFFPKPEVGFAVSYDDQLNGLVLQTNNNGLNWTRMPIEMNKGILYSLFFKDEKNGFIVGEKGTIIKWEE